MITAPPDPGEGDNILAWARRIGAVVRQIMPRESNDVYPETTPGGTKYTLRRERPGAAGGGIETVRGYLGIDGKVEQVDAALVVLPDAESAEP